MTAFFRGRLIIGLLTLVAGFGLEAPAADNHISCELLFNELKPSLFFTPKFSEGLSNPKEKDAFRSPHLALVGSSRGVFGGRVLSLVRKKARIKHFIGKHTWEWTWDYYNQAPDLAGSFLNSARLLPKAVRSLFSLQAFDQNMKEIDLFDPENQDYRDPIGTLHEGWREDAKKVRIIKVADSAEAVGAMTDFVAWLKRAHPELLVFGSYSASEIVTGESYLEHFYREKAFPIGTEGNLYEHDFNFHLVSALLTPKPIAEALLRRTRIILLFRDFFKAKSDPRSRLIQKWINDELLSSAATVIDLQGNFGMTTLAGKRFARKGDPDVALWESNPFKSQSTPEAFLRTLVRHVQNASAAKVKRKSLFSLRGKPILAEPNDSELEAFFDSIPDDLRKDDHVLAYIKSWDVFEKLTREQRDSVGHAAEEFNRQRSY